MDPDKQVSRVPCDLELVLYRYTNLRLTLLEARNCLEGRPGLWWLL